MVSFSVKINLADDELYENFIEPRKNNGELPNLLVRLLTAYAKDPDIAYNIDQLLDREEDPAMCDAREAIFNALARFNAIDSTIAQGIEVLDGNEPSDDDEYDIVDETGTGSSGDSSDDDFDIYDLMEQADTVKSIPDPAGLLTNIADASVQAVVTKQNRANEDITVDSGTGGVAQTTIGAGQTTGSTVQTASSNDMLMSALGTLTAQMTCLTESVASMVAIWSAQGIPARVETQSVQIAKPEVVDKPVAETPVQVDEPMIKVKEAPVQAEIEMGTTADTGLNISTPLGTITDNTVEPVTPAVAAEEQPTEPANIMGSTEDDDEIDTDAFDFLASFESSLTGS